MSAIAGLLYFDGRPVDKNDLERMSSALAAHGPESSGFWMQGAVGLVQRLMRFTPEDCFEQQPLLRVDRQLVLVSDPRINNRPELARELGISPAAAVTLPDSAFILRAYEEWGEACPTRLRGEFAFVLWDGRQQHLFLARSQIGGRPLFYSHTSQMLAFATMPRGLLALPCVPCELNEEKLADFLVYNRTKSPTTLYRGVLHVPRGHILIARREGVDIRCYWQPDWSHRLHFPRDEHYLEAFRELFDRVISDHLRSATAAGVMMSGGLDSASVAATAAGQLRRGGKRLAAFTEVPHVGFAGPVPPARYADETPLVQAIARVHDNLDLNLIRTDGRTFLDDLDRLFFHLEMPFRNTFNWVWIKAILEEARQQSVRVLLMGVGGNLTFSWNGGGLLMECVRHGRLGPAWREARAQVRRGHARAAWRTLLGQGILPLLPAPLWALAQRWRDGRPAPHGPPWRAYSPIHPAFAAEHKVEERARRAGHDFYFQPVRDLRLMRWQALADSSMMSAAYRAMYGVDVRRPTMDQRIVEFCFALPEEQFLRDGLPRRLARLAMADRLPSEVLENRQRGLQAADWFERLSAIREQIVDELVWLERSALARRALDLQRMRHLVENWPRGGWGETRIVNEYRSLLTHGLMVGRFILWFEAGGPIGGR